MIAPRSAWPGRAPFAGALLLACLAGLTVCGQAGAQPLAEAAIAVWRGGQELEVADGEREGLLVLDLGDDWVPVLFTGGRSGPPNAYEPVFRDLANERWPDDYHGDRARQDRYLELYGIPPSLLVLRERMESVAERPCRRTLDLDRLRRWGGADLEEDEDEPAEVRLARSLAGPMESFRERLGADIEGQVQSWQLTVPQRHLAGIYARAEEWTWVVAAMQARLACDGHLRAAPSGEFDPKTKAALAELERHHRIYARASLTGATLRALRTDPLELERLAVIRVLTERAKLTAGYIEDGSTGSLPDGSPRTYRTRDGRAEALRNLETELRDRIIEAFGLQTAESTRRWLAGLGDLDGHRQVAIDGVEPPEYYGSDMDLRITIDRGDVWYDFPYDAQGNRIAQPIDRRPVLTLYARYLDQDIPLVRYRSTIGGWRILRERGRDVWEYKESPVGRRVWSQIVSTPVWLPPANVQPDSLVMQTRRTLEGEIIREVNQGLVGPGYASAYGLVAAYHRRVARSAGGLAGAGTDEGIRTHGSVDYTSIWRRASLGCHRLHNHLAVRLFSFIVAHRAHRRTGHRRISHQVQVSVPGFSGQIDIRQTGYTYDLARPIEVSVLPGRIRGRLRRAPTEHIPVDYATAPAPTTGSRIVRPHSTR